SLIAIAIGMVVLIRPKGTAIHKSRGRIYVGAIVVTSVTALGIYRVGGFFFAHWFGLAALVITAIGATAVHFRIPRVGWMHLHLTCMLGSFYILIGGGVNEVFLRLSFLRRLAPNLNSPIVGLTHFSVMVLFALLIGYFNIALLLRVRTRRLST